MSETKKRILLVDDDELVCEMMQLQLEDRGYECNIATNVEDAKSLFYADPQQFDLILLDHIMLDVTEELHEVRSDLPIALYTGSDIRLDEVRSRGITAVFHKPLTGSELSQAIKELLDNE